MRATKSDLPAAVYHPIEDVTYNIVDLDANVDYKGSTGDQRVRSASETLQQTFRESSITAWVMKPVMELAGRRKGFRNEVGLVKALPKY